MMKFVRKRLAETGVFLSTLSIASLAFAEDVTDVMQQGEKVVSGLTKWAILLTPVVLTFLLLLAVGVTFYRSYNKAKTEQYGGNPLLKAAIDTAVVGILSGLGATILYVMLDKFLFGGEFPSIWKELFMSLVK